ncbi:hypothetical protein SAMN05720766_13210 [Fibrobacter sp. UWH9]|nr:hypothetical protein [Fibrobacter succinogenes]SHH87751.1 hypothetical protein SAMN05720766_13210 [Fibrobacter sp. UWH9]
MVKRFTFSRAPVVGSFLHKKNFKMGLVFSKFAFEISIGEYFGGYFEILYRF